MAQICRVIQADPQSLATALLALNEQVLIVEKTASSGKFLVVSKTPSTGQSFVVILGDPQKLSDEVATLAVSNTVSLIIPTFSASSYVVVYS